MPSLTRLRQWLAGPPVRNSRFDVLCITASAALILGMAQLDEPGSAAELLLVAPAAAAFVLRGFVSRLYPELFAVAVLVPICLAVVQRGHLEGVFFLATLVSLYNAWHLGTTLRSLAILAACSASPWLVAQILAPEAEIGWQAWSSACLFTFGLGMGLRAQEAVIAELNQAREALAAQAVAEERRRIARELHDLAGHTLAAVLLHVTGARHVLRRDIDEAERALVDAETVGRASLDQIRATVAALRTDERGTDSALAGPADLMDLVDEYRRAGLEVALTLPEDAASLVGPVGTALHRIGREALANVARHAPTNRVHVTVTMDDRSVRLAVTDHGRPAPPPDRTAGHFGLIGMAERARALGGELDAGPSADGWVVTADLPVTTTAADLLPS